MALKSAAPWLPSNKTAVSAGFKPQVMDHRGAQYAVVWCTPLYPDSVIVRQKLSQVVVVSPVCRSKAMPS